MIVFNDPLVYYLSGTIIMFMLGIAAGNYATSLVYRLPKGLIIANDPPYCECSRRVYLKKRDLFPLFSWLLARGKCRYCDIKIPATYAMIEFLCGFLFVSNWMIYGFGEDLVLVLAINVILITIASIYYLEQRLMPILLVAMCGLGGIYRTLLDGDIFGFVKGGYLGMMIGLALWGLQMAGQRSKTPLPAYVLMMAVGGLCVGQDMLLPFFIVAFIIATLSYTLKCVSQNFIHAAWVIGVAGSVILAFSHVQ